MKSPFKTIALTFPLIPCYHSSTSPLIHEVTAEIGIILEQVHTLMMKIMQFRVARGRGGQKG